MAKDSHKPSAPLKMNPRRRAHLQAQTKKAKDIMEKESSSGHGDSASYKAAKRAYERGNRALYGGPKEGKTKDSPGKKSSSLSQGARGVVALTKAARKKYNIGGKLRGVKERAEARGGGGRKKGVDRPAYDKYIAGK